MKKKLVVMVMLMAVTSTVFAGCGKTAAETTSMRYEDVAEESVAECTVESNAGCEVDVAYDSTCEYEEAYGYEEEYDVIKSESYSTANENAIKETAISSLSTFAADVDTASYTNLRRMINDGYGIYDIPEGAIRTEEIVNYFKYNYTEPLNKDIFGVTSQLSECPWNKKAYLLALGINTANMDSRDIPDCNIVFLVDISGSMKNANKLPLIQKAMAMLVEHFDENDRISIVTYASGVNTVLDGCKGSNSRKIIRAFEKLNASGSTNGGDGIKTAYEVANRNYIEDGVNRVIICSDGDFNVGLTTKDELEELITQKKDEGIFLSTLGFGMGNYSDVTMETLADKGNGNYAYIDDLTEAKRVLVDEMTSTFVTVAKDVKLQVEFNPALVSEYRLVGYENRVMADRDFTDDSKDGGEMGAGHQVTALYEIILTEAVPERELKYQDTRLSKKGARADEYCTLSIAYKDIDSDSSKYLEYPIGIESYTKNPDDDYMLSVAAAQASLAYKNSEYLIDITREEAIVSSINIINKIKNRYKDEYVTEFGELLQSSLDNSIALYSDDYAWYE